MTSDKALRGKDLRERSTPDLESLLGELRQASFKDRMRNASNQLENVSTIRRNRRNIARVLTVIAEKNAATSGRAGV